MSLPLIVTPEAEEDLSEAKAWYERKRKGLGEQFLLCVEPTLDHLHRVPAAGTRSLSRRAAGGGPAVSLRRVLPC